MVNVSDGDDGSNDRRRRVNDSVESPCDSLHRVNDRCRLDAS